MARARFHVFSGTGNSRDVARRVASSLAAREWAIELVEVSASGLDRPRLGRAAGGAGEGTAPLDENALDVFVFPVYAMAVPRIMVRYMKGLGRAARRARSPAGPRPRAALLSTNGRVSAKVRDGHEGQALAQAERILRRSGWDVVYRETFDYPHNLTNFASAPDAESCRIIVSLMDERIERVAFDLAEGRRVMRPCPAWALLLGWPFGWLFRIFGRRCFGMLFAADERCSGCGLCAARCPAGAIAMRGGRPAWSYRCEACERCINTCPERAIQGSLLRVVLALGLGLASVLVAAAGPPAWALAPYAPSWASWALWIASALVLSFVALRLADLILVALGRLPFLRPILGFGWTRWTRRYPGPRNGE